MALWMAVGILWCLYVYLNDKKEKIWYFHSACWLYFGICFVHERYMALFPLLLLVLLMKKARKPLLWGAALGSFLFMQLIRLMIRLELFSNPKGYELF